MMRRKLIIDSYLKESTIHGLLYLKSEKSAKYKVLWLLIVIGSIIAMIISTILLTLWYLEYHDFILTNEAELETLETLPNILLCEHDKPSIVDSIRLLKPELNNNTNKVRQSNRIELNRLNSIHKVIELVYMKMNLTVSNDSFDSLLINLVKKEYTIANQFLKFDTCEILARNKIYNCINYIEMLFTINGICYKINLKTLLRNVNDSTLLQKQFYYLSYHNDYKIGFNLKLTSIKNNLIYLSLINDENLMVYSTTNSYLVALKDYKTHFIVNSIRKHYSNSLHNQKCINSEIECHFSCLKLIITHLLECHFTLKDDIQFNPVPFCTLNQLIIIEEVIIKNYIQLRNLEIFRHKCKMCLPSCEQIHFIMNEIFDDGRNTIYRFKDLQIYFSYKMLEVKHKVRFEFADYMSYLNGLWSLFLGISLLSIWELIEFFYGLLTYNGFHIKKPFNPKCFNVGFNIFQRIFRNSQIHGFKYLFKKSTTNDENFISFIKIRWLLVIFVVSISFSIMVSNAITNYTNYESTLVKTTHTLVLQNKKNVLYDQSERLLTFLICSLDGLQIRKKYQETYKNLTMLAEKMLKSMNQFTNFSEKQVLYKEYVNSIIENYSFIIDPISETKSKNNSIKYYLDLYKQVFDKQSVSIAIEDSLKLTLILQFYFNSACTFYETKSSINYFRILKRITTNLVKPLRISILDSHSLHLVSECSFNYITGGSPFNLVASLKHINYLNAPYKPSCIAKKAYIRDECFKECINEIISEKFDCKLIHEKYDKRDGQKYCHPFMIPLIQSYEKYQLNSDMCNKECKSPCEMYYYETQIEPIDVGYGTAYFFFRIENSIEIIQQVSIDSLTNTLYIIISYFGLFFGGSLLAIIQIFSNSLIDPIKLSNQPCFDSINSMLTRILSSKFFFITGIIEKSTTIHCINYISSSNPNKLKRFLWILLITAIFLVTIYFSLFELNTYLNHRLLANLNLINLNKTIRLPKIDACTKWDDENLKKLDESGLLNDLKRFILAYKSNICDDYLLTSKNCSLKLYIQEYFKNYHEIINKKRFNNQSLSFVDDKISAIKLSSYFKEQSSEKLLNSIKISNEITFKDDLTRLSKNHSTYLHYTGLIYTSELGLDICTTLDWKLIYQNSFDFDYMQINPFMKSLKSQYTIRPRTTQYRDLYFENKLLTFFNNPFSVYLKFHRNIHHKNIELNKLDNSITKTKSLMPYNEYKLFFCNKNLRNIFYEVFNCTPFYIEKRESKHDVLSECPVIYMPLIVDLFKRVKSQMFNCEIINNLDTFDVSEIIIDPIVGNTMQIDLNDIDIYEEDLIKEYSTIKLIINISNFWNVFMGCSFISLIEIIYLFYVYIFKIKIYPSSNNN